VSIVVDASVWVSASIPDDVHHQPTRAWLAGLSPSEMLVSPALGLVETAGAVSRRTGSPALARQIVAAIEQLPNVIIVIPDAELWTLSVESAAARRLRGADAMHVGLAQALGVPLATWDADQRKNAEPRVHVITPGRS